MSCMFLTLCVANGVDRVEPKHERQEGKNRKQQQERPQFAQ